ncbi:glycoside hydrolase family 2 TIM barrel-domain containing protein [uncultured Draconibacterium sp.]|uniref:glycoside hydrolase family 2 protein n=1 Tax=uncultured Draconibacterium sp. TaxID=1573823 RepID=UPI0025F71616|nr:glycoside hydrolase family 2 TIM barrel-domain containing protein [uncultured Draconibacterium sp.]
MKPYNSSSIRTLHKKSFHILLCFFFIIEFSATGQNFPEGVPSTGRKVQSLNQDWKYFKGDAGNQASASQFNDNEWANVNLPHTYQLTSVNLDDCTDDNTQETFHRDICWYRRSIDVNAKPGQRVFLEFEGAHQLTEVWVNGKKAGAHAISGYTPFHFDITDLININGENKVSIKLDNRKTDQIPPDGDRWDYVLFGGLYRDVFLVVTDPLYVTFPWEKREAGVFITTPTVNLRNATVSVRTTVRNAGEKSKKCEVVTRVIDKDNIVVLKLHKKASIDPGREHTFIQTGGITENMRLWEFDDPYLYRVNTQILYEGKVVDMVENPLGLRWFEMRPGVGFCMNGKPVELVGANRHQQFPYVGDAVPDNLHWADAYKFKASGMNVVRLAHYPHDNAFFDACDKLGILVCEEPPTWIEFGPEIWMDRLEESFRRTIRNHRNHPSAWGWGAGINHRGPVQRLQYAAKEEDPTRITMNNGTLWTGPQHAGVTDLYAVMDYRGARRPKDQFLFAMEHSGSEDTWGNQKIVSRYKADPDLIGLTLWSAHDSYSFIKRGEQYPNLSRWSAAAWDIFRLPKPVYWWMKSEMTTEPMVHIPDHRAQNDSTIIVFSNCDEVELLIEGKSIARLKPCHAPEVAHLNSPAFVFDSTWESGTITAKGYINNKIVAEHSLKKPGEAHHIELEFDKDCQPLYADGSSIALAFARICDKNGTTVVDYNPEVSFEVSGSASIVGGEDIGSNPVKWENGIAPVLVRMGTEAGEINLIASAKGLKNGNAVISSKAWTSNHVLQNAKPIRDVLRLRIDLGNPEQHVQDQFVAWSWSDKGNAKQSFIVEDKNKINVSIESVGDSLKWTHTWGVPGDLSFMIEDGVEINAPGKIMLTFNNLPEGEYSLKSWHHRLTGEKDEAPVLKIEVSDANSEVQIVKSDYQPTYGRKIQISTAGGGNRGDGGSNKAAKGFSLLEFKATKGQSVKIVFSSEENKGTIGLNGFDLKAK